MAIVTIISVGTIKEAYLREALAEYKKRISQYARVEEINLNEEKITNEDDPAQITRALDAEAVKILSQIPDGSLKIALCVEGKEYDSIGLADLIRRGVDEYGKIALIIGSSHGLSNKVKTECNVKLSFSRLTFPHQLIRVNLYEALYRSFTIIAGKKYHK